ncbi:hypothetical protein EXW96_18200 [Paenibacillus sp. JMULE4]|nr:hypothetical protein [Paenibacillus sp. JMULE4]NTZ19430.1 hypothetical protein [Paenibacillus sp. JMULE4]
MDFGLNEIVFSQESKNRDIGLYIDLVNSLKTFVLYKLGSSAMETIYLIQIAIKNILEKTHYINLTQLQSLMNSENQPYVRYYYNVLEFLDFYNLNVDETCIEIINYHYESYCISAEENRFDRQRKLEDFQSIFRLGEAIDWYWDICDQDEKEKYYPLKIWWEITTKIPLRTTEFCLTPYDCTRKDDDKYFLTLKRTLLKGNVPAVSHKIKDDYEDHEIRIDEELYLLIQNYKAIVDHYDSMENFYDRDYQIIGKRQFLLSHRSYFKCLEDKKSTFKNTKILEQFNEYHLRKIIQQFYVNVLQNKFNYQVIPKNNGNELQPYQIELISPMDTRHYAFINLVLNDIEPIMIKEIARHGSVDSSYHYYNHVGSFVKCFTYSMAKRMALKNREKMGISIIHMNSFNHEYAYRTAIEKQEVRYREVTGGRCINPSEGFEECLKNNNDCAICRFFRRSSTTNNQGILQRINSNEEKLATEIDALQELVKQFKRSKNFSEDYGVIINKIKSLANQNALLLSKYVM